MKVSEEIADKAKVVCNDKTFGFIKFEHVDALWNDKFIFTVSTRKGVKEARRLAKLGEKTSVQCAHCPKHLLTKATEYAFGTPVCKSCLSEMCTLIRCR